jgi:hypothetical protein
MTDREGSGTAGSDGVAVPIADKPPGWAGTHDALAAASASIAQRRAPRTSLPGVLR